MNTYTITASKFVEWACQCAIKHRVRGLIEHYAHHKAVLKYQGVRFEPQREAGRESVWFKNENMPSILRHAVIELSESNIQYHYKDLSLIGRVDQFYMSDGTGVLVDTKSHAEPTFKDQLQLSFYAFILQRNGYQLSNYAYIRCAQREAVSYREVDLLPNEVMTDIFKMM